MNAILENALRGARISPEEAVSLLKNGDWTEMAQAAHLERMRKLPGNTVGYTVYRIINYTNVCSVRCSFCSFCRGEGDKSAFTMPLDEIRAKALDAKAKGADQIFLQGGVNPTIPLSYYENALRLITNELKMTVRGFSPVELVRMSGTFKMPLPELLRRLKDAGLSSVPGAGAEILTDRMRNALSPRKLSADEWINAMRECHRAGLPGSANIVFGSTETPEDIAEHLERVRALQDETHGFKSFVAWTFQPQTKNFTVRHVTAPEYLKVLALCRLYLDNVPHIEVSVLGMGKVLGELGLRSGADDINSPVLEENVLVSHGFSTIAEAEAFLRGAGFTPRRRSLNFD